MKLTRSGFRPKVRQAAIGDGLPIFTGDILLFGRLSIVLITNKFEICYLIGVFALLGVILIGAFLSALHLDRWHPKLISAIVGALLGFALIEAVSVIT